MLLRGRAGPNLVFLWGFSCAWLGAGQGTASAGTEPWVGYSWAYRTPIHMDPALIAGSGGLTGFPILLRFTAAQSLLMSRAKADGTDLVVTRGDGVTVLPREIVRWDPGASSAEIWFRADMLSDPVNTFYLYYGNPDTTVAPLGGDVWGSSFLGVYHFDENPGLGVLWDYGPGGHHGLAGSGSFWTAQNVIPGAVGQGWRFNGTTNWIDGDQISSSDSTYTMSGWIACWKQPLNSADFAFCVGGSPWHLSAKRNETQLNPDFAGVRGYFRWNPDLPDTLLHYYVWSMDGVNDTIRFYYDGVERGYKIRFVAANYKPPDKVYLGLPITSNVSIGSSLFGNSADLLQGIMDEFRVRVGTRSPDWVLTEYNNQKQPANFVIYEAAESRPVGIPEGDLPLRPFEARLYPNPLRRSTMVAFELLGEARTSVTVYGVDGRLVRRLYEGVMGPGAVRIPWDGRGDGGEPLGEGVYFLRIQAGGRSWATRAVLLR